MVNVNTQAAVSSSTAVSSTKLQHCKFYNISVSKSYNNQSYTDVVVTINGRCIGEHNNNISGGGIFNFQIYNLLNRKKLDYFFKKIRCDMCICAYRARAVYNLLTICYTKSSAEYLYYQEILQYK